VRNFGRISLQDKLLSLWHWAFGIVAFTIPILPWIARSFDGRIDEAFSILPQYNLVSKTDNSLVYQMLEWHKLLVLFFWGMVGIHVAAVLLHTIVARDNLLASMIWRRRS
jgi:cytochrome b561